MSTKQDSIANFPLRSAAADDLGIALARTYADFGKSCGQAFMLEEFVHDADAAGVRQILAGKAQSILHFAESEGLFKTGGADFKQFVRNATPQMVDMQVTSALRGAKLATTVLVHNALDVFFFRTIRFGLAYDREQAMDLVSDRKVSLSSLHGRDPDEVADEAIENWWWGFERESLIKKWERTVKLLGYPSKLSDESWHFDLDMLKAFDAIRHSAVHHEGGGLLEFDLVEFSNQLRRAMLVWMTHVGITMGIQAPLEEFMGLGVKSGQG